MDSYPSTQTCNCFSIKGSKVKKRKKLGIIAMQRGEAGSDPLCASERFSTALG